MITVQYCCLDSLCCAWGRYYQPHFQGRELTPEKWPHSQVSSGARTENLAFYFLKAQALSIVLWYHLQRILMITGRVWIEECRFCLILNTCLSNELLPPTRLMVVIHLLSIFRFPLEDDSSTLRSVSPRENCYLIAYTVLLNKIWVKRKQDHDLSLSRQQMLNQLSHLGASY